MWQQQKTGVDRKSASSRILAATVLVALGLLASTAGGLVSPRAAGATEAWELDMLAQLNAYRAQHGRGPLTLCTNLSSAAYAHSADRAAAGSLSHHGTDGSTPSVRVGRTSYGYVTSVGENMAAGPLGVGDVMTLWKGSPGHAENMLDSRYVHVGFGRAHRPGTSTLYWTQVLAWGGSCTPHVPVNNPIGSFDSATSPAKGELRLSGWAADRDAGTSAISVHAYVDGVGYDLGRASKRRDDLAPLGLGVNHGFDSTITVTPGSKHVCLWAINVGSGGNQMLGCRTVWVADPASPFTDLLSTNPFFSSIVWMRDQGLATGNADGSFGIVDPTTRQAMAAFLYRVAGSPAGPFPDPGFTDVGPRHPFRTEIAWMAHTGLATGYADGSFGATRPLSRQATVAFLHRMDGSLAPRPGEPTFRDVPSSNPFRDAIRWAAGEGITTGWPDGTFRPGEVVSRQSVAAFLHRWQS